MIDPITSRIVLYRALFIGLVLMIALGRLLPVGSPQGQLPGPDLLQALTCVWVMRRAVYVPAWLIVLLFLPLDFMLQKPPGLGALAMLAGSEVLRHRANISREQPFPVEWMLVTAVLVGMAAATQMVQVLLVIDRPPLGLALLQALFTAGIYPIVVGLCAVLFGLRRGRPGEVEALGDRV